MAPESPSTFLQPEFLKKLERLRLVAKRLSWSGAGGEHPSPRKGCSLEFSGYREYHRGDDFRYVDWNAYRRLERLFLKLFTAEEEMNIYLLLDVSRSMGEGTPAKIEYAKSVAAALGYIGLKNLDRVGGATFSSDLILPLPLGRGRKQILTLFDLLGKLSCKGETNLQNSIKSFSYLFPRPGLVVLLSDLFDPRGCLAGLEELLKKKYQVLVIHILDEGEIRLEPWGDVSLHDVENEREKRLFLDGDLVRRFHQELERYFEEISSFCLSRRMDYLRTTTKIPFEDFVLLTLRQVRSVR
ncbi:MAG: DUF58 domain-containing protein [Candidatus Binatota bacterium]